MELQFQKKLIQCMRQLTSQVKHQELTQEVRLPEGMPDIDRVICCWGQILIRGKEWRQESVGVSGGVMVWILYKPENDDPYKVVETWIPFNTKIDISGIERDGNITALGGLCYQDVRSVSARKLMLRMGICINIQVHAPYDITTYESADLPGHVLTKKSVHSLNVPSEIGEKSFSLEEQLPLPDGAPGIMKIIRYSVVPEILEQKVLGGKLVFRGVAQAHVLYESIENKLNCFDIQIPFSQFTELDHDFEEGTDVGVWPAITNIELTPGENDAVFLKLGMTGQYIVYSRLLLEVTEDAYSTVHHTQLQHEQLDFPVVLQENTQRIKAEVDCDIEAESVVDVQFMPCLPTDTYNNNTVEGRFYVLFYDREGALQSAHIKWEQGLDEDIFLCEDRSICLTSVGPVQTKMGMDVSVQTDVKIGTVCKSTQGINMICGITMDEEKLSEDKPSIVLIRAGEKDLWDIAKENGSSVEAISNANSLSDVPVLDQVLIIPVL